MDTLSGRWALAGKEISNKREKQANMTLCFIIVEICPLLVSDIVSLRDFCKEDVSFLPDLI
jgi:hypothetical protein